MRRRRFLALSAAALATPAWAVPVRWTGYALGAEASLIIHAPRAEAQAAIAAVLGVIAEVERQFSLYAPTSALSRLNAKGTLHPDPSFEALLDEADRAFDLTEGFFDPSVQGMALARAAARRDIPWPQVRRGGGTVRLQQGQALTLNGIAQGFATDLAVKALESFGLRDILVNIGEFAARGGPWRLGLSDPQTGYLGTRTLHSGAIATSSPWAEGARPHILHPTHEPRWSTVSVEADTAVRADALSTGLCFADEALLRRVAHRPGVGRITVVDRGGDLRTF